MFEDTGWKCLNCGNFNVRVNTCPKCGKEKGFKPSQTLVCPKCRLHDKIEKVSAIVKKETRTRKDTRWREETYKDNKGRVQTVDIPVSRDVIEISNLAKELLPPEKPEAQREGTRDLVMSVGILFFSLFAICIISTTYFFENRTLCIAYVIGAMFLVFIIMNLRSSVKYKKDLAQVQSVEIPRWNNAIKKWDEAYYCYRDDIVFTPDGKWASSSLMSSLLNEPEANV